MTGALLHATQLHCILQEAYLDHKRSKLWQKASLKQALPVKFSRTSEYWKWRGDATKCRRYWLTLLCTRLRAMS